MGKMMSRLNKEYYRFNAENRAHRFLDKEKFAPSPRHPTTIKHLDEMMPDQKTIDELSKKNVHLDDNLRQVFVKSHDPEPQKPNMYGKPSQKLRALPVDRTTRHEDMEFGYTEPEFIPEGKVTIRQAIKLLTDHQADPQTHNPVEISKQYKLSLQDTENILMYFSNFRIFMPEPKGNESGLQRIAQSLKQPLLSVEKKEK